MKQNPLLVLSVFLTIPLAESVQAQQSSAGLVLEEVTVTARKRETDLQDTPIAVSAFTSNMLESMNINNPFDYESRVPSFTYQENPNRISIRGVGRFSNFLGVSPGVGVYIDGIYRADSGPLFQQPINVQRTEILRGPQGTLYGRNTTGGAVNVLTKKPTDALHGDFRVALGNKSSQRYSLLVSGPITDNLRYKVYADDFQRDGLQENLAGADLRSKDETYLEAQLEWELGDKLSTWVKYSTLKSDYIQGAAPSSDAYDCLNSWDGLTRSVQFLDCQQGKENVSVGDVRTVAHDTPGSTKVHNNYALDAWLTYHFDSAELKYLFGRFESDFDQLSDYDATDNSFSMQLNIDQFTEQTSHELQLTSTWTDRNWNYIAGLYYLSDQNEQPFSYRLPEETTYQTTAYGAGTFRDNPLGLVYFHNAVLDNESWAAYGEVDFELAANWTLSLGARYSEDDFKGGETQLLYYDLYREFGSTPAPFAFDVSVAPYGGDPTRYVDGIDATRKDSFDNLTGRVNLSYRPRQGHLFWATIADGYKMGGFRLGLLEPEALADYGGVNASGNFKQEDVIMAELGWKADLFDNTLRSELIAFYYDYNDMQQLRHTTSPPPANVPLEEVVNVDTRMYGLEASATWLVSTNLQAVASYSYNHSEITSDAFFDSLPFGERDENNQIIPDNVKGSQLALTPEHKGALSLHHQWPSSLGLFTLGGTYAYIGKRYFDLGNHVSEDSYTRLDLQASWTSANERYRIQGLVNNATDATMYNTRSCTANRAGVYGTPSFIVRCSGDPMDQRLYSVEFRLSI